MRLFPLILFWLIYILILFLFGGMVFKATLKGLLQIILDPWSYIVVFIPLSLTTPWALKFLRKSNKLKTHFILWLAINLPFILLVFLFFKFVQPKALSFYCTNRAVQISRSNIKGDPQSSPAFVMGHLIQQHEYQKCITTPLYSH